MLKSKSFKESSLSFLPLQRALMMRRILVAEGSLAMLVGLVFLMVWVEFFMLVFGKFVSVVFKVSLFLIK